MAKSGDRGNSFGGDKRLTPPGSTNLFPWVDARNGKVAVAWYGADVVASKPDNVPADTKWYTRYSESIDAGASYSAPVDVAFARSDFICTAGINCDSTLGGPGHRELGDFLSVALDADGKALVTYVKIPSSVKVAKEN